MRRLLCLIAVLLVALTACELGNEAPDRVLAAATISELLPAPTSSTTTTTAAPAPPPEHCADYENMERGVADARNQQWFNQLDGRGYARVRLACVYRGGADEWAALDELWEHESGWGANGEDIPQAKPRSKMGCEWTDDRCEVRWGLGYISDRYGAPSVAWRAWRARSPHWY